MKEGNRDGRLQTDAETRPLYRKEEQIQSLPEPKIETGEMKGRVSKIRDERNRPQGSSCILITDRKTEGQRKKWSYFLQMCPSVRHSRKSHWVRSFLLHRFPLALVQ